LETPARLKRSAKIVVKIGGICWAMTTGACLSMGTSGPSIAFSASGPPVELPTAMILGATIENGLRAKLGRGPIARPRLIVPPSALILRIT